VPAMARNVDNMTAQAIKIETPPSHWSAGEMRIAYDAPRHQLYYFEQTPLWGVAYDAGFRKQIQKYLGSSLPDTSEIFHARLTPP
jgi:hypothetical protein